jgi:hypothetical protein
MKCILFPLVIASGLATSAVGQTVPTHGHIQYEVAQKIDLNQVHIVINGQRVKPGSPDFPTDIPDTRSFGLALAFTGSFGREERESGATRVVVDSGPGMRGGGNVPQTSKINAPFQEMTFVNFADRVFAATLTVTKDEKSTTYRANQTFAKPDSWKETGQTKKIAGYTCRQATANLKGEAYTIWYTQDLPFTYSPMKDLVPTKGVVLAIEGEKEAYKATKIDTKSVAEADVHPTTDAQIVTATELKELREKAVADFRQKMMENMPASDER